MVVSRTTKVCFYFVAVAVAVAGAVAGVMVRVIPGAGTVSGVGWVTIRAVFQMTLSFVVFLSILSTLGCDALRVTVPEVSVRPAS